MHFLYPKNESWIYCFKQKKCNHIIFARCGYPKSRVLIHILAIFLDADFTNSDNFSSKVQVQTSHPAARFAAIFWEKKCQNNVQFLDIQSNRF